MLKSHGDTHTLPIDNSHPQVVTISWKVHSFLNYPELCVSETCHASISVYTCFSITFGSLFCLHKSNDTLS
jgi:hypothetical protein